jgi:hypothetical protein
MALQIDPRVSIENAVLVLVTAVYVLLTYRLVSITRKSSSEQLRLATLPHIYCRPEVRDERLWMHLSNTGQVAAHDIVALVLVYLEEEQVMAYPDLFGSACTKESLHVSILPHQKQVSLRLTSPEPLDWFQALVQYRDIRGVNYAQLYSFSRLTSGGFTLSSVVPAPLIPSPRIFEARSKVSRKRSRQVTRNLKRMLSDTEKAQGFKSRSIPNRRALKRVFTADDGPAPRWLDGERHRFVSGWMEAKLRTRYSGLDRDDLKMVVDGRMSVEAFAEEVVQQEIEEGPQELWEDL